MRLISKKKLEKIASSLSEGGLDAAVFINIEPSISPEIPYLSGMHGMLDGALILDSSGLKMIVTDLDYNRVEKEATVDEIIRMDKKTGFYKTIKGNIRGYKKIGIVKSKITLKMAEDLGLKTKTEDIGILMAQHRAVKEEKELDAVRESARITNKGIRFIGERLSEGFTERELASMLEHELKLRGSEKPAFETLFTSGERSALIHPYPGASGKKIGRGPGIIDFGSVYNGYYSDTTVPFIAGSSSPEIERMHNTVSNIWKELKKNLKAGVATSKLHDIYKNALEANGYELRHSLGHGIGLEVHEYPSMSSQEATLKAGMTVAVEPGVYVDGLGGYRLENDVIIKKGGCEIITKSKLIRL